MSWASEALAAIRKIMLLEDRMARLAGQVDSLMALCQDLDRRLLRVEAKFELIEKAAISRRRKLRDRSES